MAWIAFAIVMGMFLVVFGFVVYTVFFRPDIAVWLKASFLAVDGLLGWTVRHIVRFLFPVPVGSATSPHTESA